MSTDNNEWYSSSKVESLLSFYLLGSNVSVKQAISTTQVLIDTLNQLQQDATSYPCKYIIPLNVNALTSILDNNEDGELEIHYTNIYNAFQFWVKHGCFYKIFTSSVTKLFKAGMLDTNVIHGDDTCTAAKKRGDNLGYNGYKHAKGDKVVPFCDRNCNVIAPFVTALGNRNETILLTPAISNLKKIAKLVGIDLNESTMSLDGVYNSRKNRKAIFNIGMIPNIPENKRNRKKSKRGRKQTFYNKIFKKRFRTIERIFAWEDKFKRLLLRFEFHSIHHYAMKTIAYSMINLRHFC